MFKIKFCNLFRRNFNSRFRRSRQKILNLKKKKTWINFCCLSNQVIKMTVTSPIFVRWGINKHYYYEEKKKGKDKKVIKTQIRKVSKK
jgi:hypothetical protein